MRVSKPWIRPIAGGLVALTALMLAAPPASAGERTTSVTSSSSLAARAATSVAKLKPTARALMQTSPAPASSAPAEGDRPFFRTRTGVAAIVLMVAGTAYVAYSIPKDNEKVHSPIR